MASRSLPPASPDNQPHGRSSRHPKLTHYQHFLELLEELLADSPLVQQLRAALDRLTVAQAMAATGAGAA